MLKVSVLDRLGFFLPPPTANALNKGIRRNLSCEYRRPEQHRNPPSTYGSASASDRLSYAFHKDDGRAHVRSLDFPTILFLDPGILKHGQVELCPGSSPVAEHILHLLGDADHVRATASISYEHVHSWMPFISRKRFYDFYLPSPFQSRPEVVLLLLSLKLYHNATSYKSAESSYPALPCREVLPPSNRRLKYPFFTSSAGCSTLSSLRTWTRYISCSFLICWSMCSLCARSWHQLQQIVAKRRVLTFIEVDERRKTWWAIVILDRLVLSSFYPLYDKSATIIGPTSMTIVAS